jgi:hypothetical protein
MPGSLSQWSVHPSPFTRDVSAICRMRYTTAVAEILHIDAINRLIDEELVKAKVKYGPRHFDIIVLENSRGDTISSTDALLARSVHASPRTWQRYDENGRDITRAIRRWRPITSGGGRSHTGPWPW